MYVCILQGKNKGFYLQNAILCFRAKKILINKFQYNVDKTSTG